MNRFWEIILGLEKGFLSREGEYTWTFNPIWPDHPLLDLGRTLNWLVGVGMLIALVWLLTLNRGQGRRRRIINIARLAVFAALFTVISGTLAWNLMLAVGIATLVTYVYWREGRSLGVRVSLAVVRVCVLAMVVTLLNRPVLKLGEVRHEPSVLALLVDKSVSMRVKDLADASPMSRLEAIQKLLNGNDAQLVKDLSRKHILRFYSFSSERQAMATVPLTKRDAVPTLPAGFEPVITTLEADGQTTQVARAIRSVLTDLQGQQVAGVVVFTDGRDVPGRAVSETLEAIRKFNKRIYPVVVGTDKEPLNLSVQALNVEDSVFKGDLGTARIVVRGTGLSAGQQARVRLRDNATGETLKGADNKPAEATVTINGETAVDVEIPFRVDRDTTATKLDLGVEIVKQAGESDDEDNVRIAQVFLLDSKINVLFAEGYPRWDYRFLKNELIRDKSVNLSVILLEADPTYEQEGDEADPASGFPGRITRFPEKEEEFLKYDVILFGDIDRTQFADTQLALLAEFVGKKGGGFGMIAGSKHSPQEYRGTPIANLLPVKIDKVDTSDRGPITEGFRPVVTRDGDASGFFRFFADKELNEKFMKETIPVIFWYCRGIVPKPGVGEVFAEHPTDASIETSGRKAPLMVVGQYGAGRTLFSGIDDSWRWRYYTNEAVFDTYWIQQLRHLARSRKLGQRRVTFVTDRQVYEQGEQIHATLKLLDRSLESQLGDQLRVEVIDNAGQVVAIRELQRVEGQREQFKLSWTADRLGQFQLQLGNIAPGIEPMVLPIRVAVPRLEMAKPTVDRNYLSLLAAQGGEGSVLNLAGNDGVLKLQEIASDLLAIPSAAKNLKGSRDMPLWDAPLALALFVLLLGGEWIIRKAYGML